jgi:pimeloyl-ACP methyl ester carboxylesterase
MIVTTSFGDIHIIASGKRDAPPLFLLPMGGMSATMWFPNVGALSEGYRVYAVDTLNDLGKSIPTRPTRTQHASAAWLVELFDALGVDSAFVVGASNGGWLAANLAIHHPERLRRIALLSPAGVFKPLSLKFYLTMLPVIIYPHERLLAICTKPMASKDFVGDKRMSDQMLVGLRTRSLASALALAPPISFSDKELRKIEIPCLLLYGELEIVCNPQKAVERARRTIPHIEAEIIPNAGHGLSQEKADIVNARLLKFFG